MNAKKLAVISALALALVVGLILSTNYRVSAAGANRYVAPAGLDFGDCSSMVSPCATIRFAVMQSVSGDTVNIAAGTYSEGNQAIFVDKSLTLRGPNAGISPNTGARGAEATITTLGTDTSPNTSIVIFGSPLNVTIEGLEFAATASTMTSYSPANTVTIRKNIFRDMALDGMYFEDPQLLSFDDNLLRDITDPNSDTVQIGDCCGQVPATVSFTNNVWRNIMGSGGLNLTNVTGVISGNSFTDVQYYGVLLGYGSHDVNISGNTFDRITNPAPDASPPFTATWGSGVRFYEAAFTGPVSVSGNIFRDSYIGVGVRSPSVNSDVGNITVTQNSITGNGQGIRNDGTGILTGECNWWNAASGPGPVGPGAGDKVSSNVDYSPWLLGPPPGSVCTVPTKHECKKATEDKKKAFDEQQKAADKAFDDQQKAAKKAFDTTHPTPAQRKAFDDQQKAARKAFDDQQKAAKKAFDEQNKADKKQCDMLA